MMPNGHVLFAAGTIPGGAPDASLRIRSHGPIATSLTDVTPTQSESLRHLPTPRGCWCSPAGRCCSTTGSSQLYVYTPSGSPQAAWKPTITSVVANGNNYTFTGTQLNGLSAGASYGDDAEMDTNYPIVELRSGTGQVYFARTFNWSSTGVATGSTPVTHGFFAAGLDALWNLFADGGRQRHLLRSGLVHRRDRGLQPPI